MTKILTEEELKEIQKSALLGGHLHLVINSHIAISERCRLLVLENDELNAEIMMRVRYEGFLRFVINCKGNLRDSEDFEWFKNCYAELQKPLEELK